jgi:predicted Zn-dependent peptidase
MDEFATLPERMDRVTAQDVQKAARAHLHRDLLRVIVVGDKEMIGAQLEQMHLGAIEDRDAYGEPVK